MADKQTKRGSQPKDSKSITSVVFFQNGNTAVFDADGQQIAELQDPWFDYEKIRKLASLAGKASAEVEGLEFLPNDDFRYFYQVGKKKGNDLRLDDVQNQEQDTITSPPTSTQSDKELEQIRLVFDNYENGYISLEAAINRITHLIAEETNTARIDEATKYKHKMSKHFTSWGGNQGNCVSEDVIDDRLATLKANKGKS